jgi:hypothetical protein
MVAGPLFGVLKGLWEGVEALTAGYSLTRMLGFGEKKKEGGSSSAEAAPLMSNPLGLGVKDELIALLANFEALSDAEKKQSLTAKDIIKINNALGKMTEAQQRKIQRIIGLRESQKLIKEEPKQGPNPGKGGIRIDTVTKTVVNSADEGIKIIKLFAAIVRNGGENGEDDLVRFLRNGIVSEPAKEAEQMMDGLAEAATHLLDIAGMDEETRDNLSAKLDDQIYAERLKRLKNKCRRKGLPVPTHL